MGPGRWSCGARTTAVRVPPTATWRRTVGGTSSPPLDHRWKGLDLCASPPKPEDMAGTHQRSTVGTPVEGGDLSALPLNTEADGISNQGTSVPKSHLFSPVLVQCERPSVAQSGPENPQCVGKDACVPPVSMVPRIVHAPSASVNFPQGFCFLFQQDFKIIYDYDYFYFNFIFFFVCSVTLYVTTHIFSKFSAGLE